MRIIDYIDQGGVIMYILLFLNIVGLALMIAKFIIFSKAKRKIPNIAEILKDKIKLSLGTEPIHSNPNVLIELTSQEVSAHIKRMERGLSTIKIIASISPLLGLLGTVIGVFLAFKIMSESGLSDPSSFAQGISMALITTVGGLIVAIPHYIGHSYLLSMLDTLEVRLEKKLLNHVL